MSSVWLIRAIVWCSPQFGHWETSSKRLRQLTQRSRPGSWVGRSQGSPQLGQLARRSGLGSVGVASAFIGLIMPIQPGDEEAGGAVAVGPQLQTAGLGGCEAGGAGTEIGQLQRRELARPRSIEQGRDPLLVLAPGDRAGRV